jgi:hypothetical protein
MEQLVPILAGELLAPHLLPTVCFASWDEHKQTYVIFKLFKTVFLGPRIFLVDTDHLIHNLE